MSGKKTVIITLLSVLLLLTGVQIFQYFSERIEENPPGTVGNTAGNLNNGGLYCEAEGRVYFSNAYDGGTLYSMNPDESDIKKLSNAEIAYINHGGRHLYYYQKDSSGASGLGFVVHMSGLYRCETDGGNVLCLDKSDCNTVVLLDNTLFYEKVVKNADTRRLYSISTGKKNMQERTTFLLNPASAANGGIYYNGTVSDHYLYYMEASTGSSGLLYEYNMWFPTLCDNYIYFLDMENDYQLCRYSLAAGMAEVLTTDRVDCFNVYGNYIYYQKNEKEAPALMRMQIDGTNPEVVANGNFTDINITSQYVYFHTFGADTPVYRTPTGGAIDVRTFENAKDAAYANMDK